MAIEQPSVNANAWAPLETTLLRNVEAGADTIRVTPSDMDDLSPGFWVLLGEEMVTVTDMAGDTWTLSPPLAERHFSGSAIVQARIRVVAGGIDYTGKLLSLTTKEASPEGELEAVWEIETADPTSWMVDLEPPADFTVYRWDGTAWVAFFGGRMGRVSNTQTLDEDGGSHHITFTGRGCCFCAGWDAYSQSQTWPAGTAAHVIMQDSRDTLVGAYISSDNTYVVAGGQSVAQELEAVMKSARQLWNDLLPMGDAGYPYDWYVRTGPDGGQRLHVYRVESQPLIRIPLRSIRPSGIAHDVENQRTKVIIKWAGGYVPMSQPGALVTRVRPFDYSTQIDNYDLAVQVARSHLAMVATLEAVSDGSIVVEYPKPIYLADGTTEIELCAIRAGWRAQIDDFDSGGLTVGTFQIKHVQADHFEHTVALDLGERTDDLDLAAQFVGKESRIKGSPVSTLIPQNIAPPEGVPQGVGSDAVAASPTGRVGAHKIAEDFDISTIWFPLTELDDGSHEDDNDPATNILRAWTYYGRAIRPDARILVRGLWLGGTDGGQPPGDPSGGTLKVSITRGGNTGNDYPALGDPVGDITLSGASETTVVFPEAASDPTQQTANNVFLVNPGEYLLVTVENSPPPALYKDATLGIMVQRTEGSTKPETTGGPTINSVSGSINTSSTDFLVSTDRLSRIQIEWGPDTTYGSRSQITDQLKRVSTLPIPNLLPAGTHYRVHAYDSSMHETISGDHVL